MNSSSVLPTAKDAPHSVSVHDPATLYHAGWITAEEYADTLKEIQRGATPISALSLCTQDKLVWNKVAEAFSVRYYAQHHELKVLSSDLFTPAHVLSSGILPHRNRGMSIQGVTYDPLNIMTHHPHFPGLILDVALVAPSTWRYLYDLAYPHELIGTLSEEQTRALIGFAPTGSAHTLSPEQNAEWQAVQHNLRYIDVRRDPVDDEVRGMISPALKTMYQAYPHHLEGTSLVVITPNPGDLHALHALESVTQRKIIPCVTTKETIDLLMKDDDLQTDASTFDDALDRLTRTQDFQ